MTDVQKLVAAYVNDRSEDPFYSQRVADTRFSQSRLALYRSLLILFACALFGCQTPPNHAVITIEHHGEPTDQTARPNTEQSIAAPPRNSSDSSSLVVPPSPRPRARTAQEIRAWDPDLSEYDATVIAAVQQRWYDLLWSRSYNNPEEGEITLVWTLHDDGSISDLKVLKDFAAPGLARLCESAVKDVAPFAAWPYAMRQKIGKDQREITFNFNYSAAPKILPANPRPFFENSPKR